LRKKEAEIGCNHHAALSAMHTTAGTKHYRVLHVLDHSWPVLSGYSVRSQGLITAQHLLGFQPQVVTGPLHQLDDPHASDTFVSNLAYHRTLLGGNLFQHVIAARWPILREAAVVKLLRERILNLLDSAEFDVIHAHSPALCGLAAWQAASARNLPLVYEIRSFWEERFDRNANLWMALRYHMSRRLEFKVAQKADAIVGIAIRILQDLRSRGVTSEKLFHVSNGVDTERFSPAERNTELARQLGIGNELVFGFIGSLYRFEGISWLVRAVAELKHRGVACKLLIVGDGEDTPEIRTAIRELQAEGYIQAVGRIPHDQILRYYSVMDVLVYPRSRSRLTEHVTPLKPLEAMALRKAVLASEVGGIRELVESENTGLLFRAGDIEDFCRQAQRLSSEESLRRELGERARRAVLEERDWKVLVRRYQTVYEFAIVSHRNRTTSYNNATTETCSDSHAEEKQFS
jgi:glycogen(starch) synthase